MRIGIIALLHESNTFSSQPTTLESFRENLLLTGEPIRDALADTHHETGGFFAGLAEAGVQAVPLFAARALPSGTIAEADFLALVDQMLSAVREADQLDGILVAPHGATVSEPHPDADGFWLSRLRQEVGPDLPIIGTLDAHANLSPLMVSSCDALTAYRTNPHLDQRARGLEAASLMVRTVRGEIRTVMAAEFPPMAISIERQCTDEPHLRPLYDFADTQLADGRLLSNSILLGFPYSDVPEMGSAVVAVADGSHADAAAGAAELADKMWTMRDQFAGDFTSVAEAVEMCRTATERICLLDMGDNTGGGSSADGTELIAALHANQIGPTFACLYDAAAAETCRHAGIGSTVQLSVGGRTDDLHGSPIPVEGEVLTLSDGRFHEPEPRHGGMTEFDQGATAVIRTTSNLTIMLTSRRMVPFSLHQLTSCGVDPESHRFLVAKGVNAPIAAYREVCNRFIRVNTIGSTCADMSRLTYHHRRRPMFPLEQDTEFRQEIS